MKNRIDLVGFKDVMAFVAAINTVDVDVYLVDRTHRFKVNAKSQLAALLASTEWSETWIECEKDIYELIKKWVV